MGKRSPRWKPTGWARMLDELQDQLQGHRYRATPVRRVYLLKADGKSRGPLGIPRVRARVGQLTARLLLEPIFEASFKACARGFRPKRSAVQAACVRRRPRAAARCSRRLLTDRPAPH